MTKKQCIMIAIISAILTMVFIYLCYYFLHEMVEVLFWIVSTAFALGASIWLLHSSGH